MNRIAIRGILPIAATFLLTSAFVGMSWKIATLTDQLRRVSESRHHVGKLLQSKDRELKAAKATIAAKPALPGTPIGKPKIYIIDGRKFTVTTIKGN